MSPGSPSAIKDRTDPAKVDALDEKLPVLRDILLDIVVDDRPALGPVGRAVSHEAELRLQITDLALAVLQLLLAALQLALAAVQFIFAIRDLKWERRMARD